ncbi:DUF1501 domain-containing protein [Nannocystis sp.]|uniref:DUF1501 domain-containing protein n=1 Tax=Nannocystis sp. TaxID=1962667 RepID=UPI0025D1C4D2|nr:DUF1501 domain-containing protein [Nannocystis sp.]
MIASVLRRRALLAGGLGLAGAALLARPARAAWGSFPADLADLALPPDRSPRRLLELNVYGGLCPWDTFYCAPSWGLADHRYLHAFGDAELAARLDACGVPAELARPFAEDTAGELIHLGPWTAPLWSRPDILARTRVLVLRHDQFPHATAVPLALTGARLGDPTLAGSGAAIERFFRERDGGTRPRAAVVHPGDLSRFDNVQSALAVGLHPGAARPLELPLSRLPDLLDLLARPATATHGPAHDAAVAGYTRRLGARLRRPDGAPLRATELGIYAAIDAGRRDAAALAELLPPSLLGVALGDACGEQSLSIPGLGARVATHLLTRPDPARYALWVDAGLRPTLDGGHDTHRDHLLSAATNYTHTFQTLADQINRPDEHDPDKLDLADTLIAITSEFGRSPDREDDRNGLGHWPGAHVAVLIGGPIDAPAVVGAIDRDSAQAIDHASPAELRMALLLALGIYPFDLGGFTPDAVRGASDPRSALLRLRTELLGVPL